MELSSKINHERISDDELQHDTSCRFLATSICQIWNEQKNSSAGRTILTVTVYIYLDLLFLKVSAFHINEKDKKCHWQSIIYYYRIPFLFIYFWVTQYM